MKTIKLGQTDDEISFLIERLMCNGYSLKESRTFTKEIKEAVIDFQKRNGLSADGIVGYRSWETLLLSGYQAQQTLTDEDFNLVARLLDCEPAALKAIQAVETGGRGGFFAPGKPAILFEGHIFWNQLKKRGINPEIYLTGNKNILYPKWEKGHYKGGLAEYDRLEQACKIHDEAAHASASWGMFQIMGFNFMSCGENSINSFVESMRESECKQLILSARFIKNSGILPALQAKNWPEFARLYNGPAYKENQYDEKMAKAYLEFSK